MQWHDITYIGDLFGFCALAANGFWISQGGPSRRTTIKNLTHRLYISLTMNSTISKPSANKSSAKTPTPTSASETDSLRRRLQEAAVRQHRLAVEQRTERELQRRQAEWSAQVVQYMAAERRLQRLRQLAVQQVRSDNSLLLLAAAKLEVQRCTVGAREAVKLLAELSGTNIGGASIEKVSESNGVRC